MELRCHHCGRTFTVPATARNEVRCPACGIMLLLKSEQPHPSAAAVNHHPHHLPRRQIRRIFHPVPKTFAYFVGILAVLALLAPFWLVAVSDRFGRKPIIINEEVPINTPPWSQTNLPASQSPEMPVSLGSIDQFQGVRIDAPRETLEHWF